MMEYRVAYGVLLLLLIIGWAWDGVAVLKIKADVDEMRKEMLALLKKTTDDSNRYMDEWGACIQSWREALDLNSELLIALKRWEDNDNA